MDKKSCFLGRFEMREASEPGIVEGKAIVFDQKADLGWCDEIIEKGALDQADLRDVRFCLNHDTNFVYARSRNNNENSTMQLSIGDEGLNFRAMLDVENSPKAQSLFSAIERKDIDHMSFMFIVDGEEWRDVDSEHPTRVIKSIKKVFEVSAVTFPAYEQTSITARGLSDALESAKESLESERARLAEIERRKQKIRILTEVLR